MTRRNHRALLAIKLAHTAAWAFFVLAIVGVWVGALAGNFRLAFWCSVVVLVEVAILLLNRWHCPLTPLAARYTTDRRANFDVFLPEVIARYNKEIFGTLFALGIVLAVLRWRLAAG